MTLQDQLLDFLNKKYGVRKVKKINQDNYLDLYFPEINEDEETHLFFNTARNKIKFGFFCKDNKWMNNHIKNHSDKIEICPQGLRLIDNPEFNSIQDAEIAVISFIKMISLIDASSDLNINKESKFESVRLLKTTKYYFDCFLDICHKIEIYNEQIISKNPRYPFILSKINDFEYQGEFSEGKIKLKIKLNENLDFVRSTTEFNDVNKCFEDMFIPYYDLNNQKDAIIEYEDGGIYWGEINDKNERTSGKMIFADGNMFVGEWKDNLYIEGTMDLEDLGSCYFKDWTGYKNKIGKGYFYNDGNMYEGDLLFDLDKYSFIPNGVGKMKFKNDDVYEGNWLNGERYGLGKLTKSNGNIYEGEWKDDVFNGKSNAEKEKEKADLERQKEKERLEAELKKKNDENTIQTISYTDGSKYIGYLKDNKWTKGKYIWADGSFYDGDFKDNKSNGKGKQAYTNGDVYEGEWKDDMKHGFGKMSYVNGNIYVGEWKNGQRYGKGKITYSSGASYDGDWADNKRNGRGKYVWANGDVYEGDFYNDEMHGQAKVKFINGDFFQGEFKFGQRDSKTKFEIEADKKSPKPFTIQYTIKLKEDKGYFIKTEKGSFIRKTLKVQHIGELNEGKAKQYIISNDRDIQNGKAGTSTIIIEKITQSQF